MARGTLPKILIALVLMLALAGLAALGNVYYKERKARTGLEQDLADTEKKVRLLQKKYSEQKALVGQLMRTKHALEGQKRATSEEVEKLEKEKKALLAAQGSLKAELKKRDLALNSREEKIKEVLDQLANIRKTHKDLELKLGEAVKKHEKEMARMNGEKKDLDRDLKRTRQFLERSEDRNARLCILAGELIEKYKNKTVSDVMLKNEPFTQFKKVELEKMVQDYEDRIEKERLRERAR